jgi:hypothetical protein
MMDPLNGIFHVQNISTKGGKIGRLILVGILFFDILPFAIVAPRYWGWPVAAILILLSIPLLFYGYRVFRRKPGLYLCGIASQGTRLVNGIVFAQSKDLKMISKNRNANESFSAEMKPVRWTSVCKEVSTPDAQATAFRLTIADKEHFQPMNNTVWHLSMLELIDRQNGKTLMNQLLYPRKFCALSGHRAHLNPRLKSEALMDQLDRAGEWLEQIGYSGHGAGVVKIIPSKVDKTLALAFGAIGGGIAAIMDEKKKRKFREDLESGKFALINPELDRKLLALIDRFQWDLTV